MQTASLFSVEILHGAEQCTISLKKRVSILRGFFKAIEKAFRGHCIVSRFRNFVKTQTLIHSTKKSHAPPQRQRLVIASSSPCPLTGLVKSKNNTAHASRCKWTHGNVNQTF